MNIVIIGLGSMGKRRVRLLKQYIEKECLGSRKNWSLYGVDTDVSRCQEVNKVFHIETYQNLEDILIEKSIDCAVISTSPLSHAEVIISCLEKGLHIFTELNLVNNGYEKIINLAKEKEKVLFLSSTFLYRRELEYIKDEVRNKGFKGNYRYHVGQYLPEWHPWENYTDFFVGKKETNACREILAIELPWMIDVFGNVKNIKAMHKKISNLSIEYDDTYNILIEHESGIQGTLTVDVVTPKAERELEIWEEGFYIEWKGKPDTLCIYDGKCKRLENVSLYEQVAHIGEYAQFVVENAYYDEVVNFIKTVEGIEKPRYSFEKDRKILSLIDRIEAS